MHIFPINQSNTNGRNLNHLCNGLIPFYLINKIEKYQLLHLLKAMIVL